MKYIESEHIILEDPFTLRPGAAVDVTVSAVHVQIQTWELASGNFSITVPGFATLASIQSNVDIPFENIIVYDVNVISADEIETTIEISPIDDVGDYIVMNVYYERTDTISVITKSALSADESDDYNYLNYPYVVDLEGIVVPMALMDISAEFETGGSLETLHRLNNIDIAASITTAGIADIISTPIIMNSKGTFSNRISVLRKGKQLVRVSRLYDGDVVDGTPDYKLIEIDNQELTDPDLEFRGIEEVNDVVFITTNKGLYGFNKWGNFTEPINSGNDDEFYWSNIHGYDIAYLPDDSILIPSGQIIQKYFIRHDFTYIDPDNNKIFFREPVPDFDIEDV